MPEQVEVVTAREYYCASCGRPLMHERVEKGWQRAEGVPMCCSEPYCELYKLRLLIPLEKIKVTILPPLE